MSETPTLGLPDAAHHLGTSVRVLRRAIRTGRIPAPPHLTATTTLSAEWLDSAKAAIEAAPQGLRGVFRAKVAPFARYPGTSAWRKYPNRVREYAAFRAVLENLDQQAATPSV